jgi:acetyl-CoA carboxylase, biotin carboxylase subunit
VHGKNRAEAIAKMKQAIDDYRVEGVKTTLGFGRYVMEHPAFVSGQFDTKFVDKYYKPGLLDADEAMVAAIVATQIYRERHNRFCHKEEGNLQRRSKWGMRRESS